MKELIPHIVPTEFKVIEYKDERLAKATQRITAIYNDAAKYADTKNREIAKILGDIAEKKAYEKDGFKSVADYASNVFGIATQNAYALARAGKVYNDKDAHPELKAMSPSKIAELNSIDSKIIKEALDSGKITHETTQKALREFAETAKNKSAQENPVVLDIFTARPCQTIIDEKTADTCQAARTIDEWDEYFMEYVENASPSTPVEVVSLKKLNTNDNNVKRIAQRRLYFNRSYSIVVEFYKYTAPNAPKIKKPKFTKEELLAMLSEIETDTHEEE